MDARLLRDALAACLRSRARSRRTLQIKHRLLDQGVTIQEIADRCGVSRTLISLIIKGERKGYRHRPKIAAALGLPVKDVFPQDKRRAA